jgi:hypothetical protein
MVESRRVHLVAEKHVLRYLKGTLDYGLRYGSDREGYADSDWVLDVSSTHQTGHLLRSECPQSVHV